MIITQWFLTSPDLWCYETLLCQLFRSQSPNTSAVAAGMSGFPGNRLRICLEHARDVTVPIGMMSGFTTLRRPLER